MSKKGFTLVELIVVVAIIAVLAAIVAPQALKAIEKAKVSGSLEDFNSVKTSAVAYYSDMGAYPQTNCDSSTANSCNNQFVDGGGMGAAWQGPYLEKWPTGGRWPGSNYNYRRTAAGTTFHSTAAEEVFVTITGVPATQAARIDAVLDSGSGGGNGYVRYGSANPDTVSILIFRGGNIN